MSGTISAGDLVQFTTPGQKHFFFIGPSLKKPMVQVLVKAFVSSVAAHPPQDVDILCPESREPQLLTTQQFFQSVLEASGRIPLNAIPFRICKYDVLFHGALSVVLSEIGQRVFEIGKRAPAQPKEKGTIAFNLKRPKRPRKKVSQIEPGSKKRRVPDPAQPSGFDGSVLSVQPEPSPSSSSSSSSSESESESDSGSDSDSEHEKPFVSDSAKQERKETDFLEQIHEEKRAPASSSSGTGPQPAQATPKARAGTVKCNPFIGVNSVSLQTANRLAKCRHCLQPIEKGSARIGHAFSTVKFAAYVHFSCLPDYLFAEKTGGGIEGIEQAVDFLDKWLSQPRESSLAEQVKRLIVDLRRAISKMKAL
eukprot:s45_g22.t1